MAEDQETAKRSGKFLPWLLIGFGIACAVAAVGLYLHDRSVSPKPPPGLIQGPSSKKPSSQNISNYSVPADQPKYIRIPAIGISQARIVRLGLMANNQIAAPANIYDAGWYSGSSKPGQAGAMFIYGHVSSWTANGVFYNLHKLQPGDDVIITRGDNQAFTYKVISSKVYGYKNVNMTQVLNPVQAGKPGLNLMTCTGHVIPGTSEFDERLVVFTSLASG